MFETLLEAVLKAKKKGRDRLREDISPEERKEIEQAMADLQGQEKELRRLLR